MRFTSKVTKVSYAVRRYGWIPPRIPRRVPFRRGNVRTDLHTPHQQALQYSVGTTRPLRSPPADCNGSVQASCHEVRSPARVANLIDTGPGNRSSGRLGLPFLIYYCCAL